MADDTKTRNSILGYLVALGFGLWSSTVGIATYMVMARLDKLENTINQGILPRTADRLERLEERVDDNEDKIERLEHGR